MLFVCGNRRSRRILREDIRSERNDIVAVITADDARRVGVRHKLILVVDPLVEFVGVGIVILLVENRRFRPIAVEREEGHVHIQLRTVRRL